MVIKAPATAAPKRSAQDLMTQARMVMIMSQPFFGTILLALKPELITRTDPRAKDRLFKTMATDGVRIFYNEEWCQNLTDKEFQGVVAHEVLHVANLHHTRQGHRNLDKWQIATDLAINPLLKASGYTLPEPHLLDPAMAGKSVEIIYEGLPDPPPPPPPPGNQPNGQPGQPDPNGQPGQPDPNGKPDPNAPPQPGGKPDPAPGGVLPHPGETQAELDMAEQDMQSVVKQAYAAQAMKDKGNTPGWMKDMVKEVLAPRIKWQDALRRFISPLYPVRPTFARPNRRLMALGHYMPSLAKEGVGWLCVFRDTSGSVGDAEQAQFFAELNEIVHVIKPEGVTIIDCDTKVQKIQHFDPEQEIPCEIYGRGGSDFRPAFKKVRKLDKPYKAGIVLSDMEIDFPSEFNDFPVIGISTTDKSGPSWMETTFLKVG